MVEKDISWGKLMNSNCTWPFTATLHFKDTQQVPPLCNTYICGKYLAKLLYKVNSSGHHALLIGYSLVSVKEILVVVKPWSTVCDVSCRLRGEVVNTLVFGVRCELLSRGVTGRAVRVVLQQPLAVFVESAVEVSCVSPVG